MREYKKICRELIIETHREYEFLKKLYEKKESVDLSLLVKCNDILDVKMCKLVEFLDREVISNMVDMSRTSLKADESNPQAKPIQDFKNAYKILNDANAQLVKEVIDAVQNPKIEFQYASYPVMLKAMLAMIAAFIGIIAIARDAMKTQPINLVDDIMKSLHSPVQYAIESKQAASVYSGIGPLALCIVVLTGGGATLLYQWAKGEMGDNKATEACLDSATKKLEEVENKYKIALEKYNAVPDKSR